MKKWRWLISVLIAGVFTLLGSFIPEMCSKKSSESSNETQVKLHVDESNKSSKKTETSYQNEGDVNGDIVEGDKTENHYYEDNRQDKKEANIERKGAPQGSNAEKPKNQEPVNIENNGNLSLNQSGGTVNQYTTINPKPQPRHLSNELLEMLKTTIPKGYEIRVAFPSNDKEAEAYTLEILNALIRLGYNYNKEGTGSHSYGIFQMNPKDYDKIVEGTWLEEMNQIEKFVKIRIFRQKDLSQN